MKNNIEWIFFDIGGVLADESAAREMRQDLDLKILRDFGFAISLQDIVNKWPEASAMLGSIDESIFKIFLKDSSLVSEAITKFKEELKKYPPYEKLRFIKPEAKDVVDEMAKRYKLGVIANQPSSVRKQLKEAGIIKQFSFLGISDEYGLRKPDPRFIEQVIRDSGADPKKSVVIDDNIERLLIPGKNFGFTTVWLNEYKIEREVPKEVDFVINKLEELKNLF